MSGNLPAWMGRWFGLHPAPGEGAVWSLTSAWHWPPWLTWLAVLAAVALVTAVYLRENRQCRRRTRLMLADIRLLLILLAGSIRG